MSYVLSKREGTEDTQKPAHEHLLQPYLKSAQTQCPSVWLNTQTWALPYRKLLIRTTQGMTLKCIVFSRSSQLQKATYCRIPFIGHPGKGKTIVMESRAMVVRGWEWGQDLTTKGQHKWILGSDEIVLYFDCSGGTWLLSKLTSLYNFKKSEFYFMWV